MKKLISVFLVLCSLSTFAQRAKKVELVSFVKEAVAYAKEVGFEKACAEFNDGTKFKRGELYIFAYNFEGVTLCHGSIKAQIGVNRMNAVDKNGVSIVKNLIEAIKTGNGFTKYSKEHPETKELKNKLSYAEKIDDAHWLGSGIYFEDKE